MKDHDSYTISLLIPVYNEEATIMKFYEVVSRVTAPEGEHLEFVFINDGSSDSSAAIIRELIKRDSRVALINFSRNFGKESAVTAGLRSVKSDAVIPIDVDLQDPPELILTFIREWREHGYHTVYGVRADRTRDSFMKRLTAGWFYRIFNMLSANVKLPENVGDFRLIDRKVIDAIKDLPERDRFMKGIFAWAGFTSYGVPYERPARSGGSSKFNYWKLWNFALDGIFSFSSAPLLIWSYLGAFLGLISAIYMVYIISKTIFLGVDTPGYASTMAAILFLGSVQLISIGVLGEYIGRIFMEVKRRPIYVINEIEGGRSGAGFIRSGEKGERGENGGRDPEAGRKEQ